MLNFGHPQVEVLADIDHHSPAEEQRSLLVQPPRTPPAAGPAQLHQQRPELRVRLLGCSEADALPRCLGPHTGVLLGDAQGVRMVHLTVAIAGSEAVAQARQHLHALDLSCEHERVLGLGAIPTACVLARLGVGRLLLEPRSARILPSGERPRPSPPHLEKVDVVDGRCGQAAHEPGQKVHSGADAPRKPTLRHLLLQVVEQRLLHTRSDHDGHRAPGLGLRTG
mmetsp:Transcript_128301/g.371418  ORF Transcript_128301/g.371418 Transcript_128301/m.371418 type:complete len:224 (+) Transcript_128301:417-1088(+)